MEMAPRRKIIQIVATAIRNSISPRDIAEHEVARYYVGAMIDLANEMNVTVGYVISRATRTPDFKISDSYCVDDGKEKKLSELAFGKKLDILEKVAKKMEIEIESSEKLSRLRNLPAHALIAMTEDGKASLWDKYDMKNLFENNIEEKLDEFLDEADALDRTCKKIVKYMDSGGNVK